MTSISNNNINKENGTAAAANIIDAAGISGIISSVAAIMNVINIYKKNKIDTGNNQYASSISGNANIYYF